MKQFFLSLAISAFVLSCTPSQHKMQESTPQNQSDTGAKDSTPRVTGIGGIFFYSENPGTLREWYTKNMGLNMNEWGGSTFEYREMDNAKQIAQLQWVPFKQGDEYFLPSKKELMINYRVKNLEGFVEQFKANGVTILDSIATYDFGKFIHIMDAEGNKIELWEPIENH